MKLESKSKWYSSIERKILKRMMSFCSVDVDDGTGSMKEKDHFQIHSLF